MEGPRKWNFEYAIFCGKANGLDLLSKKKPTAFDLEYLKQIVDREKRPKGKTKDQGGKTDRQVGKKTEQL